MTKNNHNNLHAYRAHIFRAPWLWRCMPPHSCPTIPGWALNPAGSYGQYAEADCRSSAFWTFPAARAMPAPPAFQTGLGGDTVIYQPEAVNLNCLLRGLIGRHFLFSSCNTLAFTYSLWLCHILYGPPWPEPCSSTVMTYSSFERWFGGGGGGGAVHNCSAVAETAAGPPAGIQLAQLWQAQLSLYTWLQKLRGKNKPLLSTKEELARADLLWASLSDLCVILGRPQMCAAKSTPARFRSLATFCSISLAHPPSQKRSFWS